MYPDAGGQMLCLDQDGDGYGGDMCQDVCPNIEPGWIAQGGDCED